MPGDLVGNGYGRKPDMKRRDFLRRGAGAALGALAAPAVLASPWLADDGKAGFGDRIRTGHIGLGGRGRPTWGGTPGPWRSPSATWMRVISTFP